MINIDVVETIKLNFEKIKNLKENWDGNKAVPFNLDFVNSVETVVLKLDLMPDIFPTANGTIQIEYEEETKYLEFEFSEEGLNKNEVSVFCKWGQNKEVEFKLTSENMVEGINLLLEGFQLL